MASFIVYITQSSARDSDLLGELSQPASPSTSPDSADQLTLCAEHALGKSVKEIVSMRKSGGEVDLHNQMSQSLFLVADEGMSPSSYPHTVLIVNALNVEEAQPNDVPYRAFRVLASTAAMVLTTIANGKHRWEEFWEIAQANGGLFPGQ
jgi:hypothetical protein